MFALTDGFGKTGNSIHQKTHPLEIAVNHPMAMDVEQPPDNPSQLDKLSIVDELETRILRVWMKSLPTRTGLRLGVLSRSH